jgi:hypothetical protein
MTGERLIDLDDEALGRAIGTIDVAWPPTPDVGRAILHDIERERNPRRRLSRTTVVLLVAAAILALAAAAAAAKFAVDLGGIAIESLPTVTFLPPSPVDPGVLGRAVTLEQAESALGSPLPIPPSLGTPDRVWLQRGARSFQPEGPGVVVAMAWRPGPGLPRIAGTPYGATLFVFEGDEMMALKLIGGQITPIEGHEAYGHEAFWIAGPHELDLLVGGRVHAFHVSGTVLLWREGELTRRLETALPKHEVLRIAFPDGT